jgi:hypothetical protein
MKTSVNLDKPVSNDLDWAGQRSFLKAIAHVRQSQKHEAKSQTAERPGERYIERCRVEIRERGYWDRDDLSEADELVARHASNCKRVSKEELRWRYKNPDSPEIEHHWRTLPTRVRL